MKGLQTGAVNFADRLTGVQFGLVNYAANADNRGSNRVHKSYSPKSIGLLISLTSWPPGWFLLTGVSKFYERVIDIIFINA